MALAKHYLIDKLLVIIKIWLKPFCYILVPSAKADGN